MNKQKIIILCGPTGIGKTALSLEIAQKIDAEIIVADSQTVLKEFDIGTAKPSADELKIIPHHLINLISFNEIFDAALFIKKADEAIAQVLSKKKIPLV